MEAIVLLLILGVLAFMVAVPVLLITAVSQSNRARQQGERLERRLLQCESQLDVMQVRLQKLAGEPPHAEASTQLESVAPPLLASAEPEVMTQHEGATAATPAEPAETLDDLPTPVEPEPADQPREQPADDPQAETMPQTLARLRQQRRQVADDAAASSLDKSDAPPADETEAIADPEAVKPEVALPAPSKPILAAAATTDKPASPKPAPQRKRISFEELLAGKVFVWIGAVALVLTGAFLLKYGYEQGIVSERVRVIGAGVFGLAMLGVGEWMRRRYNGIAQALCGAGVADLFGTVLAAHQLYGLIGPRTAFVLTAIITAGAVVLSLRHGPLVALLGIVGGFMLPPLLGQAFDAQPGMIVYLIALELGILAVTRKRGWMGISALTLIFSMAWSLGYTLIGDSQGERALTGLLVLATSVVFVLNTTWTHHRKDAKQSKLQPLWLSVGAVAAGAALLGLLVSRGGYALSDLGMLGLMGAGTIVLARIDARYRPLVWVVSGLSCVVLLAWGMRVHRGVDVTELGTLVGVIAGFGGLYALGGYIAGWAGPPASRRVFTWLAALSGPVYLALATFAGSEAIGWREAWWYWTAGVAGLYILGTALLLRRGRNGDRLAADLLASVAALLAFVAIGQAVNHPWPAVGWALLAGSMAVLGDRLKLTTLLHGAGLLTVIAAVLLVVPGPFTVEARGTIIFNTYLTMYALPIFAFAVVGWAAKRAGHQPLSDLARPLAVATSALLGVVLVRQGFHPAAFTASRIDLYEWPTYSTVLLGLAIGVVGVCRQRGLELPLVRGAACFTGALGCTLAIAGPVIGGNPLWYEVGGWSLAGGMLYLYGVPAALTLVLARLIDRDGPSQLGQALRIFATVILGTLVVMQVRNGFNPTDLDAGYIGLYERGTYGLALLGLAWGLVVLARYRGTLYARQAGRAVALVALIVAVFATVLMGNPMFDRAIDAGWPLVFALGYLYLLPMAGLWAFAVYTDRRGERSIERALRVGAVLLAACFAALQVRNGFHFTNLHQPDVTLYEWATYGLAWVLLGGGLALASKHLPSHPLPRNAGLVVGLGGIGVSLLGTLLIDNPLWVANNVGTTPVLNGLWYVYLPTILALAVLARGLRRHDQWGLAQLVGFAAVGLIFTLVCLLVRQGFSVDGLLVIEGRPGSREWYAYSLAWVSLAICLLVGGIFSGLNTLRYGSLAVMLLAVGKVFALDTAQLADLYRVFSFLGLGVTLILLGYVYQRWVFVKTPVTAIHDNPEPEAPSP